VIEIRQQKHTIKNHLKELREEKDWTQKKIADELNITRQTVYSIEKGTYNPSLLLAFKIAKLFDCKIEDIFTFQEEKPETRKYG
jgi:putative transcriptional regulator